MSDKPFVEQYRYLDTEGLKRLRQQCEDLNRAAELVQSPCQQSFQDLCHAQLCLIEEDLHKHDRLQTQPPWGDIHACELEAISTLNRVIAGLNRRSTEEIPPKPTI